VEPRDADRRVEEARASLLARAEELGRRFRDVRSKLDISARLAEHPRAAVAIAFAAGALLGSLKKRGPKTDVRGGVLGTLFAAAGSVAFALAKNLTIHHLSSAARDWMQGETSRSPEMESFLEH
jgi:hypothetical protein